MIKSKEEIISLMKDSFQALMDTAAAVPQERFNVSTDDKWSAAENVSHLARATKMTNIGFSQRKFRLQIDLRRIDDQIFSNKTVNHRQRKVSKCELK